MAAIEEDLSDALGQFSGARPGKIVCYVPEVSSFIGMNTLDSGIAQKTYLFFKSHRRARTVFEVDYVSDIGITADQSLGGRTPFPAIQKSKLRRSITCSTIPSLIWRLAIHSPFVACAAMSVVASVYQASSLSARFPPKISAPVETHQVIERDYSERTSAHVRHD